MNEYQFAIMYAVVAGIGALGAILWGCGQLYNIWNRAK